MDEYLNGKFFPLSLIREALSLFTRLPHASIENLGQFKLTFHYFYQIYIPREHTFYELMHIK